MRHFLKKCEEFTLCGGVGAADGLFTHGYPDNYAIYHIITKGNVKMARPFETEYVSLDADGNNFVNVKDFVSGWLKDEKVSGRPSAPMMKKDGSLLLSDDKANVIYRITYSEQA